MKWLPWLSAILFAVTAVPAQSASATGEWLVADKSARIAIHACGHRLRGTIAWERVHGLDDQNPDPSKRHRPTLGLSISERHAVDRPGFMGWPHLQRGQWKNLQRQGEIAVVDKPARRGMRDGIPVRGRDLDQGPGARRGLS